MTPQDTQVFSTDALDDEFALQFEKPWLLQWPNGDIEQFDTMEAACSRQRSLGEKS